jgi:hypothetical protein
MKKFAALSLAFILALSLSVASAETYTAGNYYTIDYPDTLTLDNTSYTANNTEDSIWLFMLVGEDYLIDAALDKVDGYEGVSLFSASQDDRQTYVDDTLEAYADYEATLVDTLTLSSGVPLYLFSMNDSDGPYYYAETIVKGISLNFCYYYTDASATPDATLLSNFETVLQTFTPVTSATTEDATVSTD